MILARESALDPNDLRETDLRVAAGIGSLPTIGLWTNSSNTTTPEKADPTLSNPSTQHNRNIYARLSKQWPRVR